MGSGRTGKDCIWGALEDQMFYADKQRKDGVTAFVRGDKVLIHHDYLCTPAARSQHCAKLSPRWFGPFELEEVMSERTARAELPPFCRARPVFNVAALKHFCEDRSFGRRANPPAPIVDGDGHECYVVESIHSQRIFRRERQFLVKWLGYEEPTWEPERNVLDKMAAKLFNCRRLWTLSCLHILRNVSGEEAE